MSDDFDIPVSFNNKELTFPAKLLKYVYTYKIEVDINGNKILFERDEERNWRAMIPFEEIKNNKNINKELLNIISTSIDELLK
jgi:hypothetical protein